MKRQMIRFSFILSFLFGLEMLRIYPSLLYMKTQGKYSLLENKVGLAASDFYKHVTKKGGPSSPSGREPGRLRIRTGLSLAPRRGMEQHQYGEQLQPAGQHQQAQHHLGKGAVA